MAPALCEMGRYADSVADWRHAIESAEGKRKMALQIEQTVAAGDLPKALADADTAAADAGDSGFILYAAAMAHAVAAERSETDPDRLRTHVSRAADLLKNAQSVGHFQERDLVESLNHDFRFKFLRQREDFQKLLSKQ